MVSHVDAVNFGREYDSVSGGKEKEKDFLMGIVRFTVKEIKVVKIADETARPGNLEKCVNECLFQEIVGNASGRVSRQSLRAELVRMAPAGASGRHRIGESSECLWWLFVADELARTQSARLTGGNRNGCFGAGCAGDVAGRGRAAGRNKSTFRLLNDQLFRTIAISE
jgi:hypothetical protein